MMPAIAQTSNRLLIGPMADKYCVLGRLRVLKPPLNNNKPTGHLISAVLYYQQIIFRYKTLPVGTLA